MVKIRFPTMYERSGRTFSAAGSPDKVIYTSQVRSDGTIELVEKGKESLYDFIQSFKNSCDINVLLARYANGDVDALSRVQGAYGDFTQFPSTYAELLNRVNQGRLMFDDLPLAVREKYNHDFGQFMAAMDQPDFWDQFKPVEQLVKEETNES